MNEGTYIFTAVFEDGCPPKTPLSFFKHEDANGRAGIVADPFGRLHLIVESRNNAVGERFHFISQPVWFPIGASLEFYVSWKVPGFPKIRINGTQLNSLWISSDLVEIKSLPVLQFGSANPLYGSLDITAATSQVGRFFLETIAELDRRTHSRSEYEVLRASALLRQILTDGLLAEANRHYQEKIRFTVALHPYPPSLEGQGFTFVEIDPTVGIAVASRRLKLDQFLKTECLWYQNTPATVLDLIRLCANAMGGVHLKDSESEHQEALRALSGAYVIPGQTRSVILNGLWSISRITLVALKDLVAAIVGAGKSSERGSRQV